MRRMFPAVLLASVLAASVGVPAAPTRPFVYSASKLPLFHCTWKGTIQIFDDFEGDVTTNFGTGSGRCLHNNVAWSIVSMTGSGGFILPSAGETLATVRFTLRDPASGSLRTFSQAFADSFPTQPQAFIGGATRNYRYVVAANGVLPVGEGSVTNYASYSGGNTPPDFSTRTASFDWLFVTIK